MLRTVAVIALLLTACSDAGGLIVPPPEWTAFRTPVGGFEVLLPAPNPERKDWGEGAFTTFSYTATRRGAYGEAGWVDFPDGISLVSTQVLPAMAEGIAKELGAKVAGGKDFMSEAYRGREYELTTKEGDACLMRLLLVHRRLYYAVGCGTEASTKVVSSFKVLPDSPAIPAKLRPGAMPSDEIRKKKARAAAESYLSLVKSGRPDEAWRYLPEDVRARKDTRAHAAFWKRAASLDDLRVDAVVLTGTAARVTIASKRGSIVLHAVGDPSNPKLVPEGL